MPDDPTSDDFPEARWDSAQLMKIVEDLRRRYIRRDTKAAVWRALVHRRSDNPASTGTYVPPPFDKSQLVIKSMVGELLYMTQQIVAKLTENLPIVTVNRIVAMGKEPSAKADQQATMQARLLMGCWHAAGGEDAQEEIAWSQTTMGVGWMLSHEIAAGWGLPDRIFYDDEPDDELSSETVPVVDDDGGFRYGERADLWERRKQEAMEDKTLHGESLFFMEPLSWDKVYIDEDQRGVKLLAVIEDVPISSFGANSEHLKGTPYFESGLIEDKDGTIIGGVSRGTAGRIGNTPGGPVSGSDQTGGARFWTYCRIYTRDEVYHFVYRSGTGYSGKVIYYTGHDYGEVPAYEAPFIRTDSQRPEERYVGALEAAYAYAPLINQLATLMSNLVAIKGTPRTFIQLPDGQFLMDEVTGEPKMIEPNLIGNDPGVVDVIQGGGKLVSINDLFRDDGEMFKLIELYIARMDKVLPSEAFTGSSGASGPAWTVRQLQAAGSRILHPGIRSHAQMTERIFRQWGRTIRRRKETVGALSVPGKRGSERGMQYYIEVKPEMVTDNITVDQNEHNLEEQITLDQVGAEKLQAHLITKRMYLEQYAGEEDPDAVLFELDVESGVDALWPQLMQDAQQQIMGMVTASLVNKAPNVAQNVAQQLTPPQEPPPPGIASAAGVVQPGVGMSVTQPALAPLQGAGPPPEGAAGGGA